MRWCVGWARGLSVCRRCSLTRIVGDGMAWQVMGRGGFFLAVLRLLLLSFSVSFLVFFVFWGVIFSVTTTSFSGCFSHGVFGSMNNSGWAGLGFMR